MLFIPFLENAFKHGVSIGQHSSIAMAIGVDQKKLTFTCENIDHSSVKKLEEEKGGIGLENVKRRLELVYPGKHALRTWLENGTYKVNLQIDLS
jgi:two-component system LytT family sensor kinase